MVMLLQFARNKLILKLEGTVLDWKLVGFFPSFIASFRNTVQDPQWVPELLARMSPCFARVVMRPRNPQQHKTTFFSLFERATKWLL